MCIMEEEQLSTSQDTHTLQIRQSNGQCPIEKKKNILKINMNKHIKYNFKADMLDIVLNIGIFEHKSLIYLIRNVLILMKAKYPIRIDANDHGNFPSLFVKNFLLNHRKFKITKGKFFS